MKGSKMQAKEYTQSYNPIKGQFRPSSRTPALHAPPSIHPDDLGPWPLPIYGLLCVIARVHPGDLGDECWDLLLNEVVRLSPRGCARTRPISLGSPARRGLPPARSLLPSRPTPPKICARRLCYAHFSCGFFDRAAHSNSGGSYASQLPQIA